MEDRILPMFEKRMKESEHQGISQKMQPIEGIRCTVCLEDYSLETERRPRILPQCLHTFCEGCLEKLVEFSDFHVVCPICRVASDVADAGGVQSLPISTRITLPPQTSSQCQDLSILRFMDPDAPACPACGSLTLYAPLGQDETVTQCHTCGWLGTGTPEVQSNLIHERDSLPGLNQGNPGPTVQRPSLIAGLCELLSQFYLCKVPVQYYLLAERLFENPFQPSCENCRLNSVRLMVHLVDTRASSVLMQIKPVPVQASLTFYHHFYIALWSGSYITSAMEYAKYQMQNDTRFGRYWCNFVLLGLDMFVNLLDVKHGMLHQKMENAEEELAQSTKQDWLNPVPYTSPVTDQKALLLEIQRNLEELIVNQGSMSSVLKLLHLLMTEAIKRLAPNNTDNVTVKLTANIISIPGVSSMLNLLGFQFQSLAPVPSKMGDRTVQLPCDQAAMGDVSNHSAPPISHAHPIAVIFPHWNPDGLLGVAQRAVAALIDLSACSQCVNALIWILPLSCDRLEQLISLLEMCQSPPTVCPQLTDKEVANLWNEPHVRDFLQVIGYEQAGKYLFHNPRDLNRSLLLGSLNLFLALRPEPLQRVALPKLDLLQNASDSVRDQQSRQESQKARAQGEEQLRQDLQGPLAQREEPSGQGLQEQSTPGVEECRPDPQEASASRKKRSRHGPQETSEEEKSRQDPQDTSAGTMRDKKTKLGPPEGLVDTMRVRKTKQSSPESLADTGRDKKNKQGPPEVSTDTVRDKETRQEPQENLLDSMKDEKTKHVPQESSEGNMRDKPNMQGPQEDSADTVRDKKNSQGPQKTTTPRNKKNRWGPLEITAARNKRTNHDLQEASGTNSKQTEQDTQETVADCETARPPGKSRIQLNSLKPLLVLRRQIMMQAPWLTVKPTSEEERVKQDLAKKLNSLRSQQQSQMHRLDLWHNKVLSELERKPEKRGNKTQDSCPKKVKVRGPRTPSTAQIPFDTSATTSQNAPLRPAAQELVKDQEENVRHRHRAAVKDLFLPFIDPLP